MGYVEQRRLGDIVSDIATIASAAGSYKDSGSIGPWIASQLTAFQQLPSSLAVLNGQVTNLAKVLPNSLDVREAKALAEDIGQRLPSVQAQVQAITVALGPVMPKIYSGTYDGDVLSALASHGANVIGTLSAIGDLLAKRDTAQSKLQSAVTDPTLSPSLRDKAIQALSSAGYSGVLKAAALLGIGYVIIRSVMKR